MLFPALLERCLRCRGSGLRAPLLNLPCHRSAGDRGSGWPQHVLQAPGCCVLGGREVLPSQLTDLMEKTSSIFMTASSFWCGKFQRYTEIEHYNVPYVPFSQLQKWSIYSHLASFRSQPLFPHPGLCRSKSLTSYYFTSKYFYIHL